MSADDPTDFACDVDGQLFVFSSLRELRDDDSPFYGGCTVLRGRWTEAGEETPDHPHHWVLFEDVDRSRGRAPRKLADRADKNEWLGERTHEGFGRFRIDAALPGVTSGNAATGAPKPPDSRS